MLKKRFWQKAYIAVIAIFAAFLLMIVFVMLLNTKRELAAGLTADAFELVWKPLFTKVLIFYFASIFILAVVLYIIFLTLSKPIEDLAFTEQRFAAGNYGIRAEYEGQDEIGRLARSFNHMADSVEGSIKSLEENAEMKQQLVDNLSHELRTPLTAIDGYADYVWQAALTEEEVYMEMEKIKNETQRLLRISNRMLEISALRDANKKVANKTPVNPVRVNRLFSQVSSTLGTAAEKMGVKLEVALPEEDYIIQGDPAMLESLVVNLVHNSMKACEKGDGVWVRCSNKEEGLQITVADSGCGMTEEQLSHLGEEFYRADKARSRAHGGAGLGVALCFQIVQAHKANLEYKSKLGKGTVAAVTFPEELIRIGEKCNTSNKKEENVS